jgi:hypothetical protein
MKVCDNLEGLKKVYVYVCELYVNKYIYIVVGING